nr:xylulose kinase-1 [Tanacetum cinerariifolium]
MTSLFAESHNMVAILKKSDAAGGFEQIIDFLSGSYINHALTVNPHVYISCIKQFWNTAVVKRLGDVTSLQALVDKKRIVITEEVVREILQLNDAEGILLKRQAQVPAQGDDVYEHAAEEVANDVVPPTPTSPSPSSPVIQSSPPRQSPCPPQPQDAEGSSHLFQQILDTCSALVLRVEGLENANAAQ